MCEWTTISDGFAVSARAFAIALRRSAQVVRVVDVLDVPALRREPLAAVLAVNEIDVVPSIVMWLSS